METIKLTRENLKPRPDMGEDWYEWEGCDAKANIEVDDVNLFVTGDIKTGGGFIDTEGGFIYTSGGDIETKGGQIDTGIGFIRSLGLAVQLGSSPGGPFNV
jgi:hypothetical protein